MSEVYNDKFYDKLHLTKEVQVLKPLLVNLKYEEKVVSKLILEDKIPIKSLNFKEPFIVCSDTQVYKSISIYGIIKSFDCRVRYIQLDLAFLLDVWYRTINVPSKESTIYTDLLIIRGRKDDLYIENRISGLIELVHTRRVLGKPTWLFLEGMSTFDEDQEPLKNAFGQFRYINR